MEQRRPTPNRINPAQALLTRLMHACAILDYSRTSLEVQKLAYFLQEAGEPLNLNYEPGHYGPYAAGLDKVLEIMESELIRGYGNQQEPNAQIELPPGAIEKSTAFLADKPESTARMDRVARLIEGFETPYGMELLATVHWVAMESEPQASPDAIVAAVHAWNEWKARTFSPAHIRTAYAQLSSLGWTTPAPPA